MTSFSVASSSLSPTDLLLDPQLSQTSSGSDPDSSFESHLENARSSDSSDDDSSTSPRTDRTRSSSTQVSDKRERPKAAASNDAAMLLGAQMPYQQVLDDRKLQLSLDRSSGQDQSQKGSSTPLAAAAVSESAKSAQTNLNASAQNKGGIAFGANLHMDSAQISQSATHNGTQAIADAKNAGGKNHQQDSNSDSDEGTKKDGSASTANHIPEATVTHTAVPAQNNSAPVSVPVQVQTAYATNAASQPVAPASAAAPTEVVDTPTPAAQNKSIDVQVSSADDNAVNVRVSQRAGDVQVTVRTPDTDLAQSLRQHLPELSDRLAQTGVHGDLWQPSTASTTNEQSSDSGTHDEAAAGQNPYSDAQSNQKQQDKNQSAWLNQMYDAESTK